MPNQSRLCTVGELSVMVEEAPLDILRYLSIWTNRVLVHADIAAFALNKHLITTSTRPHVYCIDEAFETK